MGDGETTNGISPGDYWLSLSPDARVRLLEGIVLGLNQGLRHCAQEISFALATRLTGDPGKENKLALDSLTRQTRIWSKSTVTVFKYSKPLEEYAGMLTEFYQQHSQYRTLNLEYLMVYMDDQHGMGPSELYALHTHSLQGFKI